MKPQPRLLPAVLALLLGACSGRGESYVYLDIRAYTYAGDSIPLMYSYSKGLEAQVDLHIKNSRTGGLASRSLVVKKGQAESFKLTPDVLPDLGPSTASVEWYSLAADIRVPGGYWDGLGWAPVRTSGLTTEFGVVTDPEARLPVFSGGLVLDFPRFPGMPDPWVQVEDRAPMEDAALRAATERGGRDLYVTSRLASNSELTSAQPPGASKLTTEIYRFEVRGRFPKQVQASAVRGGETTITPPGFTMLIPRVARPFAFEVQPIL